MRINELARELEIPSKQVIEALPKMGIVDKKSHSSKIDPDEVAKIRQYFRAPEDAEGKPAASASRVVRDGDEIKTKFDLSHISKPGDVLRAITQKQAEPAPPPRPRPVATPPPAAKTASPVSAPPSPPPRAAAPASSAPPKPAPRFITPETLGPRPAPPIVRPEPKPVAA